ncbi:Fc.00g090150.m01.CDS01 [Cosmosporella sp. VM-42]
MNPSSAPTPDPKYQTHPPDGPYESYDPEKRANTSHEAPENPVPTVQPSSGSGDSLGHKRDPRDEAQRPPELERQKLKFLVIVSDVVAVVLPLALLVCGIVVIRLHGDDVHKQTYGRWRNAITVLGTLFPIIFGSAVSRLVYQFARWKLEKGSTMTSLEQLLGSRSVGATITTHIQMLAVNPLTLFLLLIWAFSPLGAQAILRMLGTRLKNVVEPSNVVYFNTGSQTDIPNWAFPGPNGQEVAQTAQAYLESMYGGLLLTSESVKHDSMDIWGNVRIPFLQSNEDGSDIVDDWREVSWSPDFQFYSGLVGVPVTNVSTGNATLPLESSYIALKCSTKHYDPEDTWSTIDATWDLDIFNTMEGVLKNGTWHGYNATRDPETDSTTWSLALDRFINPIWFNGTMEWQDAEARAEVTNTPALFNNETGVEFGPTKLLFQAKYANGLHDPQYYMRAYCDVEQIYVESRVVCSRKTPSTQQNCTVVAQRPLRLLHAPESVSFLSFPSVFYFVSELLPLATGRGMAYRSDLALEYLNDPRLNNITLLSSEWQFKNVDDQDFSRRLSQLLNNYIHLSQSFLKTPTGAEIGTTFEPNITAAVVVSNLVEVYDVSRVWMGLYIVSSTVLLIGSILSAVFTHLVYGPEFLGYASTVLRDSKFIELPPETAQMTGLEVTNTMKNQRVRYGFVNSTGETHPLLGVGRREETEPIREHLVRRRCG